MKHDKSKLGEIIDNRSREDDRFTLVLDDTEAELAAQEYAEHMGRWRSITAPPEIGERVALLVPRRPETERDEIKTWTKCDQRHVEEFKLTDWLWKPFPMPEGF